MAYSNLKKYGLRQRKPLETINENENHSVKNSSVATDDLFDKLLQSPLKQPVTFKPLSHWAKKVSELEKTKTCSKVKDLYELSSPDPDESHPVLKITKKKPRPRKRKENFNLFHGLLAKSSRSFKSKAGEVRIKIEPTLIKEVTSTKKTKMKPKTANTLVRKKQLPVFCVTSTPRKSIMNHLTEPSFSTLYSPVTNIQLRTISDPSSVKEVPHPVPKLNSKSSEIKIPLDETSTLESMSRKLDLVENGFPGFSFVGADTSLLERCDRLASNVLVLSQKYAGFEREKPLDSTHVINDSEEDRKSPSLLTFHGDDFSQSEKNITLRKKSKQSLDNNDETPRIRRGTLGDDTVPTKCKILNQSYIAQLETDLDLEKNITFRRKLKNAPSENNLENIKIKEEKNSNEIRCLISNLKEEVPLYSAETTYLTALPHEPINNCNTTLTEIKETPEFQSLDDVLIPDTAKEINISSADAINKSSAMSIEAADKAVMNLDSAVPISASHIKLERLTPNTEETCLESELPVPKNLPSRQKIIKNSHLQISRANSSGRRKKNGQNESISCMVKIRKIDNLSPEISPYFTTEEHSSSDSSFIADSPQPQPNKVWSSPPKSSKSLQRLSHYSNTEAAKLNKSIFCPNSTVVLKGGKKHNRARVVMRQLQAGRLTLHNATLLPQVPSGRGRAFETLVGDLLEMQPGINESLLDITLKASGRTKPRTRSTMQRITPLPSRVSFANSTRMQPFNASQLLNGTNKTVHFEVPVSPLSTRERSVMGMRRFSRLNPRDRKSIANQNQETSILLSVFGNQDESSAESFGNAEQEETVQWTARDVILSKCNQTEPLNFSEHFNERKLPNCRKIGEGVYGEVFMYDSEMGSTVFKVIPIEGDLLVNDEPQKSFSEIISEIVISMELSNLRHGCENRCSGFAELQRSWCVQGEYPDFLLDLWTEYDLKKGSENDNPNMFPEEQLYIVLELAHGGLDLEAFVFLNAAQSLSAFRQCVFSLAIAERAFEFEHRDFHWGNVLVSNTSDQYITFILDGKEYQLQSAGVKVTIIDFTLSRMSYEGCALFNDLSVDPGLFTSQGDYQFEIYRMMKTETMNKWANFTPRTNVFWLHYTVDKMLKAVRYSRPKSKLHSSAVRQLKNYEQTILQFTDSSKFAIQLL